MHGVRSFEFSQNCRIHFLDRLFRKSTKNYLLLRLQLTNKLGNQKKKERNVCIFFFITLYCSYIIYHWLHIITDVIEEHDVLAYVFVGLGINGNRKYRWNR